MRNSSEKVLIMLVNLLSTRTVLFKGIKIYATHSFPTAVLKTLSWFSLPRQSGPSVYSVTIPTLANGSPICQ